MEKTNILDNPNKIKQIDKLAMLDIAYALPELIGEAKDIADKAIVPKKVKKYNKIVVAGMGGSAISGDVVSDALSDKLSIPIISNRNYAVPAFVDKDTLFIAISYSGNTQETLTAIKSAQKITENIVVITSGGALKELALKNKWTMFCVPTGYQPRAAFPFLCVSLLIALQKMLGMQEIEEEINEAIGNLKRIKEELDINQPTRANAIKQLAIKLMGKTPIIFAVTGNSAGAGMRLKTQFNENSKQTALLNFLPELGHNELVNLAELKRPDHKFCLIILRDEKDSEKIKKEIEIVKSLIGMQLGGTNEIWSKGKNKLSRILSLVYFGDLLSVYVALLKGIDPTPVEVLVKLKKEMSR